MTAQNNQQHFETKLKEAERILGNLKVAAEQLEKELEASCLFVKHWQTTSLTTKLRSGQAKQKGSLKAEDSKIPENQRQSSARWNHWRQRLRSNKDGAPFVLYVCLVLSRIRNGASVEEIETDMKDAKMRLETSKKELREIGTLIRVRSNVSGVQKPY